MNWNVLWTALGETLYMAIPSTLIAYLIGLPLGVLLVITRKGGVKPLPTLNAVVGALVNFLRSIPFLILLAMLFPEPAFTGYSLLLPRILGFYGTHALLVACGLSLAGMDFYQPSMKEAPRVLGVYVTLTLAAHALNMILRATVCPEANYFFTYGADISVLNLFWRMIPHPLLYELPAPLLLLAYMTLVQMLHSGLSRAARRREARA